jgi:uncharacterized membrane protein YccC
LPATHWRPTWPARSSASCGIPSTGPSGRPEIGCQLPGSSPTGAGPSASRLGARILADLRAGQAYLTAELKQPRWLDFGAFRWSDLTAGPAVRAAFGVVTPLAIGIAAGRPDYGSFAALGALPAGFVSFRGVSRTRLLAVLIAAAGMAISTFVGAVTAATLPWLLVPAVFAWAYVAGLGAAFGQTALSVSLQWPVALLIASAVPLGPEHAVVRAGLVLAGGLWQGVLVVISWTVHRGSAERSAVADSFGVLAGYAADLASGLREPPDPERLAGSRVLADPNPLIQTSERQHLLELAALEERVRATLTALSIGRPASGPPAEARRILSTTSRVLSELAASLTGPRRRREDHLQAASGLLAGLTAETGTQWQWSGDALLAQLRAACRIVGRVNEAADVASTAPRQRRQALTRREVALTLRASVGPSTEAGRHALRLAAASALAEIIVRAAGIGHGYWAVLTVLLVLRPDYASTVYRGLQRAAGTIIGAGLGVCTVLLGKVGSGALLAGIAVSLLAAYAVFTVNNLLYAVFLTDFVVVLLALLGLPPLPTAIARLAGTGIGAGLALLAYLVWPTWAGTSASENFARLADAQGRYAAMALRAYVRPGGSQAGRLGELQRAARRARIDAEASAIRLANEPDNPPISSHLAQELVSAGHRIARANLTLGAAVAAHHPVGKGPRTPGTRRPDLADTALQPRLDELAEMVEQATGRVAAWLRAMAADQPPGTRLELPPLRARQRVIWPAAGEPGSESEETGLAAATDSLVDAIDTEADALRTVQAADKAGD